MDKVVRTNRGSAKKHTIKHVHNQAESLWPNIPPAGTPVPLPACIMEEAKNTGSATWVKVSKPIIREMMSGYWISYMCPISVYSMLREL